MAEDEAGRPGWWKTLYYAVMPQRILVDEIGLWPRVYHDRRGFVVKARYLPPRALYTARQRGKWAGIVFFIYLVVINLPKADAEGWETGSAEAVAFLELAVYCAVYAVPFGLAVWLLKALTARRLCRVRFHRNGAIRVSLLRRVKWNRPRMFDVRQHRLARWEAKQEQKYWRKHPPDSEPFRTDYRDASQVMLLSGRGWTRRYSLAAFADDLPPNGEKGAKLRSVLEVVDKIVQALPTEQRRVPPPLWRALPVWAFTTVTARLRLRRSAA